jgi:hypothetical protein
MRVVLCVAAVATIVACGGRTPLVDVVGEDGASEDAVTDDGGSGDDSSSDSPTSGGGNGCFSTRALSEGTCVYVSSDAPGFSCAVGPSFTMGSCPSEGLIGCCVVNASAGGYVSTAAECYYSADIAQDAQLACMEENQPGETASWQTTPP